MASVWRRWRRAQIARRRLPPSWASLLSREFPRAERLEATDRATLARRLLVFLAEKRFEGAAGLKMCDEIRVLIAAQACFLVLRRSQEDYGGLHSVIVYPGEYVARLRARDEIGLIREGSQVRLGETSGRGAVVVSWGEARRGAQGANGGRNLVFHEFAHLLDAESGGFDGAPRLDQRSAYDRWSRVMREEYEALRARAAAGVRTDINPYATTSPAEFFAVATESFFQEPHRVHRDHPALFGELARYYGLDPRQFMDEEADSP